MENVLGEADGRSRFGRSSPHICLRIDNMTATLPDRVLRKLQADREAEFRGYEFPSSDPTRS